jgi:sulfite reductase subunit B
MDSLYLPKVGRINRVESLTQTEKLFDIAFQDGDLDHMPGQFVEVSVFGIGEAPISISSSPTKRGSFELAVRQVGNVTSALHHMREGDTVGIRGPFGVGFPVNSLKKKDILFVAGGIGLVPVRSLINYVLDNRSSFGRTIIFFGARSPAEQLFLDELAKWKKSKDVEYYETVDKGDETWKGDVGVITTLFPKVEFDPQTINAIVVGPPVMYKFVIAECQKRGIPDENIILSLERRMKCGVGKCGHCQINGKYVCKDGPVFRYSEIKNLREAI